MPTNLIAEGEVLQLMNIRNTDIDEEGYFKVIYAKTAKLFEASSVIGALVAGAAESEIDAAPGLAGHLEWLSSWLMTCSIMPVTRVLWEKMPETI